MLLNRRLLVVSLGIIVALALLAGGEGVLHKWSSQPANSPSSAGNSPGGVEDDPVDLPDTGLVQLTSPVSTTSFYVLNLDSIRHWGSKLGTNDANTAGVQDHLVVLDYGYPAWQQVGNKWVYGVQLLSSNDTSFHDISSVVTSAVNFARDYDDAVGSLDLDSHLTMVISVNSCCAGSPLQRLQGHGDTWAAAVYTITHAINAFSSQVSVVAGMDIESAWNHPYNNEQWLNSYISNRYSCTPQSDNSVDGCFYNFGNLDITISGTGCAQNSSSPWQACDIWYLSWGATKNNHRYARPLPEIYHGYASSPPWGTDATPWKDLSAFSDQQMHAGPMYFVGTLTERIGCRDTCIYPDNYPWEGFQLLSRALASNTTTRQAMHWSTDIEYQPQP
jgi:hypothetical protein